MLAFKTQVCLEALTAALEKSIEIMKAQQLEIENLKTARASSRWVSAPRDVN